MLSKVLGVTGRLFIIAGLVILGFVAYQLWGTGIEEAREQDKLLATFAEELGAEDGAELSEVAASVDSAPGPAPAPAQGEPAAVIEIPRIELARVVVEGTTRSELKKGPGHYIGTPFPGQGGNVGIAGHRTTYGAPFNRIDELQAGDEIILSTSQGRFVYRVIPAPFNPAQAWYTVDPSEVAVLNDVGDNRVTLTACHPKYSAKERIIVHAVLEGEAVDAPPPALTEPEPDPEPVVVQASVAEDFDEGLGSSPEELPSALGYGALAALVGLGAWLVARRFNRGWVVWLVATPVIVALVWNGYVHMDRYLPAI